jgi:negative regulator of genetic competence, sporulation and motility
MSTPAIVPDQPAKIEFSAEQQLHIQKLFDERFAKIATRKEAELKPLQDELAETKRLLEEAKKAAPVVHVDPIVKPDAEREQTLQLLKNEQQQTAAAKTAFEREKERADRAEAENADIQKNQAIRDAASNLENGLEFHDLPMVIELVKNTIVLDKDSGQYVVKIGGVVKQNSALEPMSLVQYFMEYAQARPYLVKSQVKGGAGSKESGPGGVGQDGVGIIRSKEDLTVHEGNRVHLEKTAKLKSAYITKFGMDKFLALPAK